MVLVNSMCPERLKRTAKWLVKRTKQQAYKNLLEVIKEHNMTSRAQIVGLIEEELDILKGE